MKVFASPLVPNSPLTPKSQSLTWPARHRRMLEGLISNLVLAFVQSRLDKEHRHTSVNDLAAVKIGETVQHTFGNLSKDLFSRPTTKLLDFFVNTIKTSTFAEFHSDRNGAR
jgi:hypothetical protein